MKFYTNFTKNFVTFGGASRLYIIEAGVRGRPYKVVLENELSCCWWLVLDILYDTPSIGRSPLGRPIFSLLGPESAFLRNFTEILQKTM